MKKLAIALAACLGLIPSFAQAQTIISLNFQGADTTALAPGDTTGVFSASNWNNVAGASGGPLVLNDSTGNPSAVTLTSFGGGYLSNAGDGIGDNSTPQQTLFGGSVSSNSSYGSGPMTITVSGLAGFSNYDLIVYYSAGSSFPDARDISATTSGSSITYYGTGMGNDGSDTATSFQQVTSTDSSTYTQGNYIDFSGLTGASQTVSLTTSDYVDINGFQIEAFSSVPEPSALTLLFAGCVLIAFVHLRRRQV